MAGFDGQIALVTGGGSGIGKALAHALARRGATVVLADVNGDAAEAVARSIREGGGQAEAVSLDVRDAEAVRRWIEDAARKHGRIDLLFNNAGVIVAGEAQEMERRHWDHILDVNVKGVVYGLLAAYPIMVRQGKGHIVNIASIAGLTPWPGVAAYAASKHAVLGLSTSMRGEGALYGVKVSAVCPGIIHTPMVTHGPFLGEEKFKKDRQTMIDALPTPPYPPERCAEDILKGVACNRAIIVVTWPAKLGWWIHRLSPTAFTALQGMLWQRLRKYLAE